MQNKNAVCAAIYTSRPTVSESQRFVGNYFLSTQQLALLDTTHNSIRVSKDSTHIKINGEYKIHKYTLYMLRKTRPNIHASGMCLALTVLSFADPVA